jgi:hypothetical protein
MYAMRISKIEETDPAFHITSGSMVWKTALVIYR